MHYIVVQFDSRVGEPWFARLEKPGPLFTYKYFPVQLPSAFAICSGVPVATT